MPGALNLGLQGQDSEIRASNHGLGGQELLYPTKVQQWFNKGSKMSPKVKLCSGPSMSKARARPVTGPLPGLSLGWHLALTRGTKLIGVLSQAYFCQQDPEFVAGEI